MQYTVFTSDGHWLASVDCTYEADIPNFENDQQVITGSHPENTMLVDGEVVEATGAALEEYNNKMLAEIRRERNLLLSKSDWTQFNDSPLTSAKKTEWATYRQALRDLPSTITDFANPVWPSQPS